TSDDADAKAGERDNPNHYEINCEQKHADVFSNHVASIWNVLIALQSKTCCECTARHRTDLQRLEIFDQVPLFRCGEFCSVIVTRIRVAACPRVEDVGAFVCVAHRAFIEHMRPSMEARLTLLWWREQNLHRAHRTVV